MIRTAAISLLALVCSAAATRQGQPEPLKYQTRFYTGGGLTQRPASMFESDLAFLQKHTKVIVLGDPGSAAKVAY